MVGGLKLWCTGGSPSKPYQVMKSAMPGIVGVGLVEITNLPVLTLMKVKKKSQSWIRRLAYGYAALFGLTLWAAYTNRLPTGMLDQIPYYDKIGHIVLYCIATYLGHMVLKRRYIRYVGIPFPIFPSVFGVLTIIEEVFQGLSPYRTLDAVDLICSIVGIGLGYGLSQNCRLPS